MSYPKVIGIATAAALLIGGIIGYLLMNSGNSEPLAGTSVRTATPATTTTIRPTPPASSPPLSSPPAPSSTPPHAVTETVTVPATTTTTQTQTTTSQPPKVPATQQTTTSRPATLPLCGYANQEMVAVFAAEQVSNYSGTHIGKGESKTVYGSTVSFRESDGRYILEFEPIQVPATGLTVTAYYGDANGAVWATEMKRDALHVNCRLQPIIMGESITDVWIDIH